MKRGSVMRKRKDAFGNGSAFKLVSVTRVEGLIRQKSEIFICFRVQRSCGKINRLRQSRKNCTNECP